MKSKFVAILFRAATIEVNFYLYNTFILKKYSNRLHYIDHLIRTKSGGTPKQMANRLNISQRTLFETLQQMKDLGAPIRYCRTRKTYYYDEEGEFVFGFKK